MIFLTNTHTRTRAHTQVGVSFSSVCFHWLISVEHPTSRLEVAHLLLHAAAELTSTLLWLRRGDWVPALYSLWALLAVYPCLFYGIQVCGGAPLCTRTRPMLQFRRSGAVKRMCVPVRADRASNRRLRSFIERACEPSCERTGASW
jgi:hypothetical protein